MYALCRRPKTAVYTAENVYTRRYTAVCMTRYTAVYGRVDGRFRPCIWPVHGRVHGPCTRRHVDTCTRPYTCRVYGQYMAVYTSRVRGRVRAMYMAEDVRTDGPYTVMYTGGVDGHGPYTAVYGRVYGTAVIRPCTGRFRGRRRVHGPCTRPPCNVSCGRRVTGSRHVTRPCTRPVRCRTTAVYTAVDGPYTDV